MPAPTPTVGCYCRVSTADQNLQRQISSTTEYAQSDLGFSPADIAVFRDKSTGTNTKRDGYRQLMADVDDGQLVAVVVHEISRMARSLQDLEQTINRVTDADAEIHFVRDGLRFGGDDDLPMRRLQMQMLGAFAEWEARVKQMNTREGIAARRAAVEADGDTYHHGRPPLGFTVNQGRLSMGPDYDRVVATLDMVLKDGLSKRQAAMELDTSRKTIRRSIERAELYGL